MTLWVVAGCLFEVSFDEPGWRLTDPAPAVTHLATIDRDGRHHLRFRAEQPGDTELRFHRDGRVEVVYLRVAPEHA